MGKIKVVVLGSNGWFDTLLGNTISLLIATDKFNIVLDAGLGFANLDKYCDQNLPTYLFLSHSHLDHLFGLHVLNKFNFKNGLTIFGQRGLKKDLSQILAKPFTIPADELPFPVKILEVNETDDFPFKYSTAPLRHAAPTIGIRLEIEDKIISYIADTGLCPNCDVLAKDADLLFTENAHPIGQPEMGSWPHLSPENGANIALKNGAKRLVLVHFNPVVYPTKESREEAERVARTIFPNSQAGFDSLEIEL